MERYADAEVIVFFVSLPNWLWVKQNLLIPQRMPKRVIVVDLTPTNMGLYQDYFTYGFLSKLVAPRRVPFPGQSVEPKTPRDWFNQNFQVFTPQDIEALPD